MAVASETVAFSRPGPTDAFDEVYDVSGSVRPHWSAFMDGFSTLGPAETNRRWETARRLLHENGVTYNIYGDPQGLNRPWQLDPVPLIISSEEWATLETALIQRARLLDRILADIYGPQRLLRSGSLPPALIFGQPGFLRPCCGIDVPSDRHLILYAADLARSPDGRWWVVSDRTQAPSGAGYALENRIVISRMFPELFHQLGVRKVADFFQTMRSSLAELAPRHRDNPCIVLLTPGPYNETYFEQAYLARYLGYTLAQGQDLTVHDRQLFLKTLGGLKPVDVLVRRVDDDFCDPLNLRDDSYLGVAGLVQVIAEGNVALANALGSSLVQNASFMAFLPGLCRELFGEDLLMPSVATWWCGHDDARAHVLAHLPNLVVRKIAPGLRHTVFSGESLDSGQLRSLADEISASPYSFTAQEQVLPSLIPSWNGTGLEPRPTLLRVHLVATRDGYAVMPGGLTRIGSAPHSRSISMQTGGGSKDTWILGDTAPTPAPAATTTIMSGIRRNSHDLPSRFADNLYWLGRYAERSENLARILRTIINHLVDESGLSGVVDLHPLLAQLTHYGILPAEAWMQPPGHDLSLLESSLLQAVFTRETPGGLRACLAQMNQAMAGVRERISDDTSKILVRTEKDLDQAAAASTLNLTGCLPALDDAIRSLAAFSGLTSENITRGQAWVFLDMGRRLERAVFAGHLVANLLAPGEKAPASVLEILLEVADCTLTYRARYFSTTRPGPVLDLLLADESNPRSLAFQLSALTRHLADLPVDPGTPRPTPSEKIVLHLLTRVRLIDLGCVDPMADPTSPAPVRQLLDECGTELPRLSELLTQGYFSHAGLAHNIDDNPAPGPAEGVAP
jgi:uncharacterized circularly permuted ATP-grasp superfamily protein/uncharacterized alpha-E superfamily protein